MKIAHIDTVRSEMLLNAINVQVKLGINELERKELIYNIGLEFLQVIFPNNIKLQDTFVEDKMYWNWWRSIYFFWEKDYINFFNNEGVTCSLGHYKNSMREMAHDAITENQFQNFLKISKNGKKIIA